MKQIIKYGLLCCLPILTGCKNEAELSMERGIQYYEWNMIEKAILEFKSVIHMFPIDYRHMDQKQIQLLSQAHHNLAVVYAKNNWYDESETEARTAFELVPSQKNRKVLDLIQNKKTQ